MAHPPPADDSRGISVIQLIIVSLCRMLFYTARRFAYPFSTVLSRGLGVPLHAITYLISTNLAAALLSPIIGPFSDRYGYHRMILAALLMLAAGMLLGGVFAVYPVLFLTFFLTGLGRGTLDPAVQAYVSNRVSYSRRGMTIGFLEISYAASALIGIPLIAVAIDYSSWRSPFFIFGIAALAGFIGIRSTLEEDRQGSAYQASSVAYHHLWKRVISERQSLGMIIFSFLTCMANEGLFVVYGPWLESAFEMNVIGLGLGTMVIGTAELFGSGLSALSSDRIGLKRALVAGQILTLLSYAVIPLMQLTLWSLLVGLFLVFFTFEYAVVTSISLATELLPSQRATMMSCAMAAAGLGRIAGVLVGMPLWLGYGIVATVSVSVTLCAISLFALLWGLRGWKQR